jgi:glycosyltransferase involved in cell wall biosynthesis
MHALSVRFSDQAAGLPVISKISVIIPTYNAEAFISRTIESVSKQTVADLEILVVDDGSTDGTVGILASVLSMEPRLRIIRQANAGVAEARNRGLREADPHARYISFLDHDDVLGPGALEALCAALDPLPAAVAAYGRLTLIGPHDEPLGPSHLEKWADERLTVVGNRLERRPNSELATFESLIILSCIVSMSGTVIRRDALERVGGFDPLAVPADDWDLWIRLSRLGPIAFSHHVVASHRRHDLNQSLDPEKLTRANRYLRKKLAESPENTAQQRAAVQVAELHLEYVSSLYRLDWAVACARQGQLIPAMKQLRHALLSYARFRLRKLRS